MEWLYQFHLSLLILPHLIAAVAAICFWKRFPRPSSICFAGSIVHLAAVGLTLQPMVGLFFNVHIWDIPHVDLVIHGLSYCGTLLYVAAVFVGRRKDDRSAQ